ncbi:GNAT family N-acetyltransferase [Psychroserpens ponticola]|uniref:GNAT family N-acetyltransferase n=1 Tax=Psychroserpens ponticola TaxID=2932268 RepID=A0ABY7S0B1_9FLAO|nr:GNAT family N-acetyltransferase [Psychroserpens ponticola]WCO02819.1 GNAT family N-acetyltransferase [Psychroserpens ponticola]
MNIYQAKYKNLETLVPLFDAYRVFYKQESNLDDANTFLKELLKKEKSVIYIATINNKTVGFTQLYPLFSSVSMKPMYLLNDLYVDSNYRNKGIGEALINKAKQLCKDENQKGLAIQTAFDNPAQHLYERLGFVKDTDLQFFWKC